MKIGNTFDNIKPLYKQVYPEKLNRKPRISKLIVNLKNRKIKGLPSLPKIPKVF